MLSAGAPDPAIVPVALSSATRNDESLSIVMTHDEHRVPRSPLREFPICLAEKRPREFWRSDDVATIQSVEIILELQAVGSMSHQLAFHLPKPSFLRFETGVNLKKTKRTGSFATEYETTRLV